MSQEDVEVVKAGWDAFAAGGLEAALAFYTEDCVAEDYPEMVDREATYHGWDGVRRRVQHFNESWGQNTGE